MDLAKYCVNAVLVEGRSIRAVAGATGTSKTWVHRQVSLFRSGGDEALILKKRGPKTPANIIDPALEDLIVGLRKDLSDDGLDAGAKTIQWHLHQDGIVGPSLSTIHRVLRRRGFVTPQPQKRPRSSWTRFESALPNECWQTDMTHWHLDEGRHVEIVNFIDDHSRAVLASKVVEVATAAVVVEIFFETVARYGLPASVLSDNGAIYTAAYRGSHTGMEIELAALGIAFKHGKPYHPQTQGKVERYHLTLKKFLKKQDPACSIHELQAQVDRFIEIYNEQRPHSARGCPPMKAWRSMDKATPILDGVAMPAHTKVRRDKIDKTGAVTLRYRSKLHHIGVGRAHIGKRVLILVADLDVRVIDEHGEQLRHFELDPSVDYQRKDRDIL